MSELEYSDFTHGLIDTIVGIVTFLIFSATLKVYTSPELTLGEGSILLVLTGLGAIFGMRMLGTGLPDALIYLLQEFLKIDVGKRFLERLPRKA